MILEIHHNITLYLHPLIYLLKMKNILLHTVGSDTADKYLMEKFSLEKKKLYKYIRFVVPIVVLLRTLSFDDVTGRTFMYLYFLIGMSIT